MWARRLLLGNPTIVHYIQQTNQHIGIHTKRNSFLDFFFRKNSYIITCLSLLFGCLYSVIHTQGPQFAIWIFWYIFKFRNEIFVGFLRFKKKTNFSKKNNWSWNFCFNKLINNCKSHIELFWNLVEKMLHLRDRKHCLVRLPAPNLCYANALRDWPTIFTNKNTHFFSRKENHFVVYFRFSKRRTFSKFEFLIFFLCFWTTGVCDQIGADPARPEVWSRIST